MMINQDSTMQLTQLTNTSVPSTVPLVYGQQPVPHPYYVPLVFLESSPTIMQSTPPMMQPTPPVMQTTPPVMQTTPPIYSLPANSLPNCWQMQPLISTIPTTCNPQPTMINFVPTNSPMQNLTFFSQTPSPANLATPPIINMQTPSANMTPNLEILPYFDSESSVRSTSVEPFGYLDSGSSIRSNSLEPIAFFESCNDSIERDASLWNSSESSERSYMVGKSKHNMAFQYYKSLGKFGKFNEEAVEYVSQQTGVEPQDVRAFHCDIPELIKDAYDNLTNTSNLIGSGDIDELIRSLRSDISEENFVQLMAQKFGIDQLRSQSIFQNFQLLNNISDSFERMMGFERNQEPCQAKGMKQRLIAIVEQFIKDLCQDIEVADHEMRKSIVYIIPCTTVTRLLGIIPFLSEMMMTVPLKQMALRNSIKNKKQRKGFSLFLTFEDVPDAQTKIQCALDRYKNELKYTLKKSRKQ